MITFLDTSALLKVYLDEPGSTVVRELVASTPVAVSGLAYVEARAGLARRRRELPSVEAPLREATRFFEGHWSSLAVVPATPDLLRAAADLCDAHPLRAGDAIQLASALAIRAAGGTVRLVASDQRLLAAAAAEDLGVLDPEA